MVQKLMRLENPELRTALAKRHGSSEFTEEPGRIYYVVNLDKIVGNR